MSDKYKISDEDIEVALRYLKLNESADATREQAIALLEDLRSGFHGMAHHNPDLLIKLKQELDEHQAA